MAKRKVRKDMQGPGATPDKIDGKELGVIALKVSSGYIWEDYQPNLRGLQAMRIFQTMADNDGTCGSLIHAFRSLLLGVDWTVVPPDDSPEAQQGMQFAQSLMDDMSLTWSDTIGEILSMLTFGWAWFEIVIKKRNGPTQKDGRFRSKYSDGLIGVRKLARRAQDSLQRWEMDREGGIMGMWQLPLAGQSGLVFIPLQRSLLFRTRIDKNNPEGYSIFRAAYRPWWVKKTAEDYEAIGIERELCGLPVVYIPNEYLTSTSASAVAVRNTYQQISRDLKFNEQGGLVLPSDTYTDSNGNPSAVPMVKVELLRGAGTRTIDTDKIIRRWDEAIARSVLADFLMLGSGSGHGSMALGKSKVQLFLQSMQHILDAIASTLNRYLLPRIWDLNGFDHATMPSFQPGSVEEADLADLGTFLNQAGTAGFLTPDDGIEEAIRDDAGLPPKTAQGEDSAIE